MTKPPAELLEFLHPYDPPIQSLGLGLRKVVLEEMAPCHEYIFAMRSKVVLLYGSSERVIADCICSIALFRRHATLMFHRGVDLEDTYGMLRGSGKLMRHLRFQQLSELDRPELRAYLRQARKQSGLKRMRRTSSDDVVTRVKRSSPTRRPLLPRMF